MSASGRKERIIAQLSAVDRSLLKQIRDALLALGVKEEDVPAAAETTRRLMEIPSGEYINPKGHYILQNGDPSHLGQPNWSDPNAD